MIHPREIRFTVHSRTITALQWGEDDQPLILALHGWLDNAESYYKLAPHLAGFRVVAIDMAGHGQSDWRSADSGYPVWGYVEDLHAVKRQLQPDGAIRILAHSLGAGVASLYAGTFPDQVLTLGLIENLAPFTNAPDQFAENLSQSITDNLSIQKQASAKSKALLTKLRATGRFPVPVDAAERLVVRSSEQLPNGELRIRVDPRLKLRSSVRLTEEQVRSTLAQIESPVLVIAGQSGLSQELTQARLPFVKNIEFRWMPGGHHLHLEDEVVPQMAAAFNEFFG
ncbi:MULTISPECIES: alpha/beta fold hydrolase [unclassified Marinobacterium]|jgi:pimeloyl-ACP methyl ester carboxylesterase|uniref:alpha/beta fold hydrolase n=1 Tax=unclassified Marinobacterium TaxID=2644139 RepID=UPI001568B619|nr:MULTISPECIES: alpha/beta hydrolase [unclassified Marinobacterium]NRP09748.1 short chain dehydrogenase [Marinobacterium sp. xm-g-48]NRP14495.1 short chain dehydrogenase [Marinobacterium sp. xm-a-152]NRP38981.1 short chain dehydrogenase [Marinobacterium sp. xm-a-121]NRP51832.1 short chain dehydrogenase [Marinobacterium sp. xm-v-242]NRP59109.1 short chain dehydrogenase [Marinobacterium sp. xm-d-564]